MLDDHGLEVLRKSGEAITPGDRSNYQLRTRLMPQDFDPPAGTKLIGAADSTSLPYYITTFSYYDGGDPVTPGALLSQISIYFSDSARENFAWAKLGAP